MDAKREMFQKRQGEKYERLLNATHNKVNAFYGHIMTAVAVIGSRHGYPDGADIEDFDDELTYEEHEVDMSDSDEYKPQTVF